MSLIFKRSQSAGFMGGVIFVLDARMDLSQEESFLVKKHWLGGLVVYDSKARERHTEALRTHLEMSREQPSMFADGRTQLVGAGKTLFRLGRASVSAAMASLSLRITVDGLISGVHIECKNMNELLAAESAIVEAGRNLKSFLETAQTFDGREEIIEF